MTATRLDIEEWFRNGVSKGFTHMIVVCDTFDHSNFPIYVKTSEDVREVAAREKRKNMQEIDEVYNLGMDMNEQLGCGNAAVARRVFNY